MQWSYGSVRVRTRTAPGAIVPSLANSSWLPSMMQAASTSPSTRALTASRSPPMWSPCLVTITSKRRTASESAGSRPARARWASGSSVDCGESIAPVPTVRPGQLGDVGDVAVAAHEHDRREVLVGVAHRHGPRRPAGGVGEATGPHPGQRRVPRDVDAPGEVGLGLGLVAGVQHVVEGEGRWLEPGLEPLPDRDDLGVVGDGAEGERCVRPSAPLIRTAAGRRRPGR